MDYCSERIVETLPQYGRGNFAVSSRSNWPISCEMSNRFICSPGRRLGWTGPPFARMAGGFAAVMRDKAPSPAIGRRLREVGRGRSTRDEIEQGRLAPVLKQYSVHKNCTDSERHGAGNEQKYGKLGQKWILPFGISVAKIGFECGRHRQLSERKCNH